MYRKESQMPKYYVECGAHQFLTTADHPRSAALWALHRLLGDRIDFAQADWTDSATIHRRDVMEPLLALPPQIRVSHRGFGLDDAGCLDTSDVVSEWIQLVVAVQRITTMIDAAEEQQT